MYCPSCDISNTTNAKFCGGCGNPLNASTRPMVGFGDAIKLGFSKYATFSGRATRAEYWWWILFIVLARIALLVVDTFTFFGTSLLFSLATLIPNLALGARRLHDINRTGWWQLLILVPVIGWILLLVWACSRGHDEPNQHGRSFAMEEET